MENRAYHTIVIGAGIVGLATAMQLLGRFPGIRLAIIDKGSGPGREQTGHNSGVIHSGVYYKPGSLKASLCVAGRRELLEFCERHEIPVQRPGKLVVATKQRELPRLHDIYRRGRANGVDGLQVLGAAQLKELEPHIAGIRAVFSPHTAVVDFGRVAKEYARQVRQMGGELRLATEVTGIRKSGARLVAETTKGYLETRSLITCAGLQSDRLARMAGAPDNLRIVPFRGDYYVLVPEKRYLADNHLIYPVPDPALPFLGVHFTRRIDGEVWAGPNAVLAFAREGYRRTDMSLRDNLELLAYPGFWRMGWHWWRVGVSEMVRDYVKPAFVRSLRRYVPELKSGDLVTGPSGVRAQAVSRDGVLLDDFALYTTENQVHVLNAPSPAATSSLAIGKLIADRAAEAFTIAPFRP